MKLKYTLFLLLTFAFMPSLAAQSIKIDIYSTTDNKKIGTIGFSDSKQGLKIKPNLSQLSPGQHGFHIHQQPDCGNQGMNAQGHLDPQNTQKHLGPYQKGHQGDLPILVVGQNGKAVRQSVAPNLSVEDLLGHSVMIHQGGDNYSDSPLPLGGGGKRIACGIIGKISH